MIITMKKDASAKELERLREGFDEKGLRVNVIEGEEYNVWGICLLYTSPSPRD